VLVQINNIYPSQFDDKCCPWGWFIPALTQLSLILPILVLIHQALIKRFNIMRITFILMVVVFMLISGIATYSANAGALPV